MLQKFFKIPKHPLNNKFYNNVRKRILKTTTPIQGTFMSWNTVKPLKNKFNEMEYGLI